MCRCSMHVSYLYSGVLYKGKDCILVSQALLQAVPAAHRGFLMRARAVPIESIYEQACRQKRRLVLSGGSCLAFSIRQPSLVLWHALCHSAGAHKHLPSQPPTDCMSHD